jgi:iron(III) transport system substrate-binding protein
MGNDKLIRLSWVTIGKAVTIAMTLWAASFAFSNSALLGATWEEVAAAAKREAKLVMFVPPGRSYREFFSAFQKKFPEIQLEMVAATGRVLVPRIKAERQAQRYLWDVYIGGPETANASLKSMGFLDPLQSVLMPDLISDSQWIGGFADGFIDREKKYVYAFQGDVGDYIWVNRDVVSESQLKNIEQLAEAAWKGKTAWRDPRVAGSGASHAGYILAVKGEDFLRKLYANVGVLSEDRRQLAEWVIRGQYPIAFAISPTELDPFWKEGVGKNIKVLDWASTDTPKRRIAPGVGLVCLINQAPHPRAAQLFINWLLSREGQEAWVKYALRNSRRVDASRIADTAAQPGREYVNINKEELYPFQVNAEKIAKEILK